MNRLRYLVENFTQFRQDFSQQLFEDYLFYKRLDIDEGLFTEVDYASYPLVQAATDIWRVLTPDRLWHGSRMDQYLGNAYLLLDVSWPNPHYFQVYFLLEDSAWKHMHTEFVG